MAKNGKKTSAKILLTYSEIMKGCNDMVTATKILRRFNLDRPKTPHDLSESIVLVSVTVNNAMFTCIIIL